MSLLACYVFKDSRGIGVFTKSSGFLKYPQGYENYPDYANCTWTYQMPIGMVREVLHFSFTYSTQLLMNYCIIKMGFVKRKT